MQVVKQQKEKIVWPKSRETVLEEMNYIENSYGFVKRLDTFLKWLEDESQRSAQILEVGCGTAEAISYPLSQMGYQVKAIDLDHDSIEYGVKNCRHPNLQIKREDLRVNQNKYDVIICSEVLEHLKKPEELLNLIHQKLQERGICFVTVPNGYGPFELEKKFFQFLNRTFLKKWIYPMLKPPVYQIKDTLAFGSPHIQFFRMKGLKELFDQTGFEIISFRKRTLFCGPLTRKIIGSNPFLCKWNNRLADLLPAFCASDWMFCLRKKR